MASITLSAKPGSVLARALHEAANYVAERGERAAVSFTVNDTPAAGAISWTVTDAAGNTTTKAY